MDGTETNVGSEEVLRWIYHPLNHEWTGALTAYQFYVARGPASVWDPGPRSARLHARDISRVNSSPDSLSGVDVEHSAHICRRLTTQQPFPTSTVMRAKAVELTVRTFHSHPLPHTLIKGAPV